MKTSKVKSTARELEVIPVSREAGRIVNRHEKELIDAKYAGEIFDTASMLPVIRFTYTTS